MVNVTAQRRSLEGFTLIELLLGLTLFSLIALTVYGVFAGGISLSRRAEQQNSIYREILWSFETMANELEGMIAYDFQNSYPERSSFSGSADKVTFLLGTDEGIKAVSYYLSGDIDGSVHRVVIGPVQEKNRTVTETEQADIRTVYLVREEIGLLDLLNGQGEAAETEVLALNVREGSLKFSYGYAQNDESKEYYFEDNWSNSYNPSILRIEMEFVPPELNGTIPVKRDVLIPTGFLGARETGS